MKILNLVLPLLLLPIVLCIGLDDLVNLPDVEFIPNFNTYAGYLNANQAGNMKMYYMLTESKSVTASTDPLLIWFNGGPGCSSFTGLFQEHGPYYASQGGSSLFENPYSWNSNANVLYLESPIGVGFSYDANSENITGFGDNISAKQNYHALKDFFLRVQPQSYADRTFFIAGQSYASVYVPQLVKLIVRGINNGDFPNKNLQGMAVGNGFFSHQMNWNSKVTYKADRGMIGLKQWEQLKTICKTGNETDVEKYNFFQFMVPNPESPSEYIGDNSTCGRIVQTLINDLPAGNDIRFDVYNIYQDCYDHLNISTNYPITKQGFNYYSSDQLGGYKCYMGKATTAYLNRPDVQHTLRIAPEWRNRTAGQQKWISCNYDIFYSYNFEYTDSQPFFDFIIKNNKNPNFRMLIYTGDVDTICNFKGVSWFIEKVANSNNLRGSTYGPWLFAKQLAGYAQRYSKRRTVIDVLTVKGAGHYVPTDRPGAALQMINNFMLTREANVQNQYSKETASGTGPKYLPLKNQTNPL